MSICGSDSCFTRYFSCCTASPTHPKEPPQDKRSQATSATASPQDSPTGLTGAETSSSSTTSVQERSEQWKKIALARVNTIEIEQERKVGKSLASQYARIFLQQKTPNHDLNEWLLRESIHRIHKIFLFFRKIYLAQKQLERVQKGLSFLALTDLPSLEETIPLIPTMWEGVHDAIKLKKGRVSVTSRSRSNTLNQTELTTRSRSNTLNQTELTTQIQATQIQGVAAQSSNKEESIVQTEINTQIKSLATQSLNAGNKEEPTVVWITIQNLPVFHGYAETIYGFIDNIREEWIKRSSDAERQTPPPLGTNGRTDSLFTLKFLPVIDTDADIGTNLRTTKEEEPSTTNTTTTATIATTVKSESDEDALPEFSNHKSANAGSMNGTRKEKSFPVFRLFSNNSMTLSLWSFIAMVGQV